MDDHLKKIACSPPKHTFSIQINQSISFPFSGSSSPARAVVRSLRLESTRECSGFEGGTGGSEISPLLVSRTRRGGTLGGCSMGESVVIALRGQRGRGGGLGAKMAPTGSQEVAKIGTAFFPRPFFYNTELFWGSYGGKGTDWMKASALVIIRRDTEFSVCRFRERYEQSG